MSNFNILKPYPVNPPYPGDDPLAEQGYARRSNQLLTGAMPAGPYPRRYAVQPEGEPPIEAGGVRRTPICGTGAPIVARRLWYADDSPPPDGWARRTLLAGLGQAAGLLLSRRNWYCDDSPPPDGWASRIRLAPTGLSGGPLWPRRYATDPTGSPAFQDEPGAKRTPLLGTGQAAFPLLPRRRVSADVPYDPDQGGAWRPGNAMLSNEGQVVSGPYYFDAMALFQPGIQFGVLANGG